MTVIQSTKGAFTESMNNNMTHVRKPVFVDNAIHYEKITEKVSNKREVSIQQRKTSNYSVATENEYNLIESESAIIATHADSNFTSDIWTTKGKNSVPKTIYSSQNPKERLVWSTTEDVTNGLRLNLQNMKGQSMEEIGFSGQKGRFGVSLDVGMRSTDLVTRITKNVDENLNSVTLGAPLSVSNQGGTRRNQSLTFVAEDFNNVNTLSALQFVSRFDNRSIVFSKEGNVIYSADSNKGLPYPIDKNIRFGKRGSNPVSSIPNRITVTGVPSALNDDVTMTLDDRERQGSLSSPDIITSPTIFDMSIRSKTDARRVGRNKLRANALKKGSISSAGHPNAFHLRSGDLVNYSNEEYMISEISHSMSEKKSDMKFMLVEKGLEHLLQENEVTSIASSASDNKESHSQLITENLNLISAMKIKISTRFTITYVSGESNTLGNLSRGIGGASQIDKNNTIHDVSGIGSGVRGRLVVE